MRTLRLKNVLYFPHINIVGGIETYCYEMGLKYGKDYDITLVFNKGDPKMLRHIAETCRVIQYQNGDEIICDTFIFGYGRKILDHVQAKTFIQTYHADYLSRNLNPSSDPRITHRFGVAENTTRGIKEHYAWARSLETMYNPYTVKKPRKMLNLVSATRLTPEKGYHRMLLFASALEKANIPFHWLVFTDAEKQFPSKNVTIMEPRYDVLDFIANADYLVQLSDTEGYSYSIVESLSVGTPVIVTDIPVAGEQGVVHGVTGFILPFDMSNIPIDAIYAGLPPFSYEPRESHYETVLVKGEAPYGVENDAIANVITIKRYYDVVLDRHMPIGETMQVTKARAEILVENGCAEYLW